MKRGRGRESISPAPQEEEASVVVNGAGAGKVYPRPRRKRKQASRETGPGRGRAGKPVQRTMETPEMGIITYHLHTAALEKRKTQLAKELGVSRTTLWRMEKKRKQG